MRPPRRILERCDGDTWLLLENSAGTGGTIGRSVEELATLVERAGAIRGSACASIRATSTRRATTSPTRRSSTPLVRQVDESIGLDRLRALHVNDSATPLGSNRDRHANILEGELGEGLGAFLAHPALQHLSAYLEVPGREPRGRQRGRAREGARPACALDP